MKARSLNLHLTLTGAKQVINGLTDIKSIPNKERNYSRRKNSRTESLQCLLISLSCRLNVAEGLFSALNEMIKASICSQHTYTSEHNSTSRLKLSCGLQILLSDSIFTGLSLKTRDILHWLELLSRNCLCFCLLFVSMEGRAPVNSKP